MPYMSYIITIILVVLSGLFSGLNLGLLSLNYAYLKRKAELGDENAIKILPLRKHGNQLLVTLLLGNVAVNAAISIFLADISTGLIGGILSTAIIVIFGEILPQSYVSRNALYVGAKTALFTRFYMFIFFPIAYPLGRILDITLGEELPEVFTKEELRAIISEHEESPHSAIDADEENIIIGALTFSSKNVSDVMTPRSVVFALEERTQLTNTIYEQIKKKNHTRIPVFRESIDNIVGILFVKDLLGVTKDVPISTYIRKDAFVKVSTRMKLDVLFNKLITSHLHLACVFNKFGELQGVVTLEDVIEEIIQTEVFDENDPKLDPRVDALMQGQRIFNS